MNFVKNIIPNPIIPILIFAIVLNILRILIWGKFSYFYILWNILLAMIPYFISLFILNVYQKNKIDNFFIFLFLFLWLLFIPNAPYLITDFIHLDEVKHAPLLFDSFLLFSSSLTGMLFGLYSISHVEEILNNKLKNKKITKIIIIIIFFLMGFGIYLGRFLRFNSWDFFTNHTSLVSGINNLLLIKGGLLDVVLYTFLFSSFIYASYKMWKFFKKNYT